MSCKYFALTSRKCCDIARYVLRATPQGRQPGIGERPEAEVLVGRVPYNEKYQRKTRCNVDGRHGQCSQHAKHYRTPFWRPLQTVWLNTWGRGNAHVVFMSRLQYRCPNVGTKPTVVCAHSKPWHGRFAPTHSSGKTRLTSQTCTIASADTTPTMYGRGRLQRQY